MNFSDLVNSISQLHEELTQQAAKAVNRSLTVRNWLIGYYIKEFEQNGSDRASYGDHILQDLASHLPRQDGFSYRSLKLYRQFYMAYPNIRQTVFAQCTTLGIGQTLSAQLTGTVKVLQEGSEGNISPDLLFFDDRLIQSISFSHFTLLMPIDDPLKRRFYEVECVRGNWSVRELKRQIESLYFERSALSHDKKALSEHVQAGALADSPHLIIRDPYVFDFLGIKSQDVMYESDLEQALLQKLEAFLLELGYGFCFEARQKRILIGDEYFFVDLVFYHRVLKCHVLIELKTGGFSHEALGQLNTYLNYFKAHLMTEGDNPPVGLLLCTEKNHALVQYACAGIENSVFVSKYQVGLPGTEEIREFVEGVIRDE
ncbi:YhcG family protein [Methanospirillum stamsii]|uniref:Cytoplasmic protein n=1 Tax=Methanospirillum stamsii TaxID=1277351 RepID=A0A2V2N299_9EURY|nr:PDDEXK nuclease domain-containing protein [Methanospirillum stamsii]PWR69581.1 cytoplasmic protein [Methanospirillum stamsii]